MIHPEETINRIKDLLLISGVPPGEVLDEMLDHYLSEVEIMTSHSISHQESLRLTYQNISNTDFSFLNKKSRQKWWFVIAIGMMLLSAAFAYVYNNSFSDSNTFENPLPSEFEAPKGWPLEDPIATISSEFGMRINPVSKAKVLHKGIDIIAKQGTLVLATGDAIVKEIGYSEKSGNYIILKHNDRYSTRYTHLSEILVRSNQSVSSGTNIGTVGSTGQSRGPHLHYEIIDGKIHIDPLIIVKP